MEETRSATAKPGRYLTFILDKQHYGVPIMSVREINQLIEITPVPKSAPFVLGVMNLRGKIIPVVDLRQKFGIEKAEVSKQTCIVVVETDSGHVGVLVDQVNDVVELQPAQIEPPPNLGANNSMDFLMGLGKMSERVLILVDIYKALSKDQFLNQFGEQPTQAVA